MCNLYQFVVFTYIKCQVAAITGTDNLPTKQPPPKSFEALNISILQPPLVCTTKFSLRCGGEDSVDWGLSQPIPA